MPDSEDGFPKGHKSGCACPACAGHRTAEERHRAEAEQAQTRQDVAWATVMRAGGPDAIVALAVQHGDPQRAVRLLEAGGFDVAGITSRWRAEAPHVTQRSSRGDPWAGTPEHDPRAMEALQTGGSAAYRAKVAELTAARDREAGERAHGAPDRVAWGGGDPVLAGMSEQMAQLSAENQRAARAGALWTDSRGQLVLTKAAADVMPQRSAVNTGVAELGSEQ